MRSEPFSAGSPDPEAPWTARPPCTPHTTDRLPESSVRLLHCLHPPAASPAVRLPFLVPLSALLSVPRWVPLLAPLSALLSVPRWAPPSALSSAPRWVPLLVPPSALSSAPRWVPPSALS